MGSDAVGIDCALGNLLTAACRLSFIIKNGRLFVEILVVNKIQINFYGQFTLYHCCHSGNRLGNRLFRLCCWRYYSFAAGYSHYSDTVKDYWWISEESIKSK